MEYVLLFFEGILTFLSPCILPMLPIYLSYLLGGNNEKKNKKQTRMYLALFWDLLSFLYLLEH